MEDNLKKIKYAQTNITSVVRATTCHGAIALKSPKQKLRIVSWKYTHNSHQHFQCIKQGTFPSKGKSCNSFEKINKDLALSITITPAVSKVIYHLH